MAEQIQRFQLQGMSCASCVLRAERALMALPGVRAAQVNLSSESAEVRFAAPATPATLAEALVQAGYPPREELVTIAVEGMSCAACTGRVERVLAAQAGVIAASANLAQRRAQVRTFGGADAAVLAAAVSRAGFAATPLAEARPDARAEERRSLGWAAVLAGVLALPLFVAEMGSHLFSGLHHWLMAALPVADLWAAEWVLASLAMAGPGRRFYTKGLPAFLRGAPDMNSLVALGTLAAWGWSTLVWLAPGLVPYTARAVYFEAAAVIIALVLAGRWMEARARGQAGAAIERLLHLQPASALAEGADGQWAEVPIAQLRPGQRLRLRPGERVALDGVVEEGSSSVDEAMLTGEAMPVAKSAGDAVTGGTVNGAGGLVIRITAVGGDTVLARIVSLVEAAQGGKLPVQALVDQITLWFVPAVLAAAALTVALWLVFGPGLGPALVAGVSVLIIACPCAMGLATPVSIMVATGRAAELGIFFRQGDALQSLAGVATVAFDKTGTLTEGRPALVAMEPASDHLLRLAAAVEAASEHPIARAITGAAAARGLVWPQVQGFAAAPGIGALGRVEGQMVEIAAAHGFSAIPDGLAARAEGWAASGITPVFLAVEGKVCGVIGVSDPVKPGAGPAMARLRAMGLRSALVTGDAALVARAVAEGLRIARVHAGVLPEGKVAALAALRDAGPLAFVGDGINDAPALAAADVGIALGSGTDIAIEAAQVVLAGGDPGGVATAIALSRATLRNIRQNLIWAFGYNIALIPVAAGVLVPFGGPQLSPMLAAGAMAGSSLFVLTNALRLARFKPDAEVRR